ncbi:MAG: hypothetical protein LBI99_01500, partial [Propionibacteriaceae bacterium]|nr:hypothetical protein [Propionibacteriaceae bacterium]
MTAALLLTLTFALTTFTPGGLPKAAADEVACPSGTNTCTFYVNSVLPSGIDVNLGDGICETGVGNGICTLRAAIGEANAQPETVKVSIKVKAGFSGIITPPN